MATQLSELLTKYGAQDVVVQALKDSGYQGDLSPGSPLYQLLIEPHAVIYAMNVGAQDALRNTWTLLSGDPDASLETDQQTAINLFNNLRITPSVGARAAGRIQLTFTNAEVRTITRSTTFLSASGAAFAPTANHTFVPSESYRSRFSSTELVYTRTASGYAVDIPVEAGNVGTTTISSGELFTTTLAGLVEARASTAFTSGRQEQSVGDLIREIPDLLSETSMLSPVSLTSYLYGKYPTLQAIRVFRAGEPEMRRASQNALGIAVPSADVVVVPSIRPGTRREFIPGYVEMYVAPADNQVFNGSHSIGFAVPTGTQDPAEIILVDRVWVEGLITNPDLTGLHHLFAAGLRRDDTEPQALSDPDTDVQPGVDTIARVLVTDGRYGNLPVMGADPRDFYFSSYQDRVKFEFTTTWEDVEEINQPGFSQIRAWLAFWSATDDGIKVEKALEYGVEDPSDVPRLLRVEVPIYVDAVYFAGLRAIQEDINDDSRRCYGQDYVVKSPHINSIGINLTVSKDLDFLIFRETYFKTKIAEFINGLGLQHAGTITTEQIKSLIFEEAPRGSDNRFDAVFTTKAMLPDESLGDKKWVTESRDFIDYIRVPAYGISDRNTVFSCSANQIGIQYL